MIQIRFPDSETEAEALGFLAGGCSFRSLEDGETLVPAMALALLAAQGILLYRRRHGGLSAVSDDDTESCYSVSSVTAPAFTTLKLQLIGND
jgi:hypothetical protein